MMSHAKHYYHLVGHATGPIAKRFYIWIEHNKLWEITLFQVFKYICIEIKMPKSFVGIE